MIDELRLTNFRCFKDLKISFSSGINLLTGINGSGKTSVIEALYILGRGRSFRTNFLSDLIQNKHPNAIIFLKGTLTKQPFKMGCEIKKSSLSIRINSESVKRRSLLLDFLPLQIITPTSHELIDSGPSYRRKFIDWGLFHVEHSYRLNWSNFRRVLKQRNQLLKEQSTVLKNWDEEFIKYSEEITNYRNKYFVELEPYFLDTQEKLLGKKEASIVYYPGWNTEAGLSNELKRLQSKDRLSGFSNCGPHKADLKFKFNSSNHNVLSRGQQKILVFALQLAQCLHLRDKKNLSPLLLIDDISSELDSTHLNRLFEFIVQTNLQSIVSSIDADKINAEFVSNMFHVEQNTI